MAGTNTVGDILEYAISREVEANILYNMMAEYTSDRQIQNTCLELAVEELEHKAKLELELMKIGKVVKQNKNTNIATPSVNPLDYISDSGKIVNMNITQLLEMAIEKEIVSFKFYIDMASLVRNEESRQALLAIAEEESNHKMRFEIEYIRINTNIHPNQND